MKTFGIIGILIICMGSAFWSCQKEDLGNLDAIFADTTTAGPIPHMTAKINGVPWSATTYDITLEPGNPGQIIVTGQSDDGQAIDLVINNTSAGDYLLSRYSAHVASYIPDSVTKSYYNSNQSVSTGGVINIATIDTTKLIMSGQFNFIGQRSDFSVKTITEGDFSNLGYTNILARAQFAVKKNYGVWTPESVTAVASGTGVRAIITITATNADGTMIVLTMPQNILANTKIPYKLTDPGGAGEYKASYIESSATLVPNETSAYNYPKTWCNLIIKMNDTQKHIIQGTFSFYGAPSNNLGQKGIHFTSGSFYLTY